MWSRQEAAGARATFGAGRVVLFSPYLEKTAGLEPMVARARDWAALEEGFAEPAREPVR